MSGPEEKKPQASKVVQVCVIVFLVIGIVGFQVVAPRIFPPRPGGGFDFERMMWAGIVGGLSAVIGFGVGKLLDTLRR